MSVEPNDFETGRRERVYAPLACFYIFSMLLGPGPLVFCSGSLIFLLAFPRGI